MTKFSIEYDYDVDFWEIFCITVLEPSCWHFSAYRLHSQRHARTISKDWLTTKFTIENNYNADVKDIFCISPSNVSLQKRQIATKFSQVSPRDSHEILRSQPLRSQLATRLKTNNACSAGVWEFIPGLRARSNNSLPKFSVWKKSARKSRLQKKQNSARQKKNEKGKSWLQTKQNKCIRSQKSARNWQDSFCSDLWKLWLVPAPRVEHQNALAFKIYMYIYIYIYIYMDMNTIRYANVRICMYIYI